MPLGTKGDRRYPCTHSARAANGQPSRFVALGRPIQGGVAPYVRAGVTADQPGVLWYSAEMTDDVLKLSGWALVLGASSGFGEAASLELARLGMNIAGVHLDRRSTMPNVERIVSQIKDYGREAEFSNVN